MIQANELRIGNLVTDKWYDSFKSIFTVTSLNDKGIDLIIEDDGNWAECADRWIAPERTFDTLFGIHLTEEWLIKFGFQRHNGWDDMAHWSAGSRNYSAFTLFETEQGYQNGNDRIIKYVHILQNAFFFDQLEELTITPLTQ